MIDKDTLKSMVDKADQALGYFTIDAQEPNQDVYYSKDYPFTVETILDDTAIYCIQIVGDMESAAVIVGLDNSFLTTGHTRKGKQYLVDKWLAGERSTIYFYDFG